MLRSRRSFNQLPLAKLVAMRDKLQAMINAKVAEERRVLEGRISELAAITSGIDNSAAANTDRAIGGKRYRRGNGNASHATKGRRVPAKYRGPNGEAWSGRGLTPLWLVALEKSGKKRNNYLVKN
jgi:DNA-binding protein H-NS